MIDRHPKTRVSPVAAGDLGCASQNPAAASPALVSPLAALLDPAFLNRGETVILALKPSLWFIPLTAGPILSIIVVAMAYFPHLSMSVAHRQYVIELAIVAMAARISWSILLWMGRLYILTDLRLLRLSGVFATDVVSIPLRKVATVNLMPTNGEGLVAVGSIEIASRDPQQPPSYWQTIASPVQVQKEILAAVSRASQSGGSPC
jgi:hypothetical protein